MKTIRANKNDIGQRVDNFIKKSFEKITTPQIYKFIRTKKIKVNGKKTEINYKLLENDEVSLYVNDEFLAKKEKNDFLSLNKTIDVVYEDDNILLVNKPSGLVVHDDDEKNNDTLINRVKKYLHDKKEWQQDKENFFAPSLANRIDRNTSGIVFVAKNIQTLQILNDKIKAREIDKYYLCLVNGIIDPKNGVLVDYWTKKQDNLVTISKKPLNRDSRQVITEYKTIKHNSEVSLVEIKLITGKTHQIRAHMNFINHPLVGEQKYTNKNVSTKKKHQVLCAYKVIFNFKTDAGVLNYLKNKEFKIKVGSEFNF